LKAATASSRVETLPMFVREDSGGRAVLPSSRSQIARPSTAVIPSRIKVMIIVHHLNESRSQRILWLLEELQAPYEVAFY
jgi:hypothetical protein